MMQAKRLIHNVAASFRSPMSSPPHETVEQGKAIGNVVMLVG